MQSAGLKEEEKNLNMVMLVIVSPRRYHRIFILDNTEYERIVIHVSDSMLKELSTAQTNLLGVFHKKRTHILHLSDEEMAQLYKQSAADEENVEEKKEFGADLLWSCVVSDSAFAALAENASGGRS